MVNFKLSAHEVMSGANLRTGSLVLRPSAAVLIGSAADALVGVVLILVAVIAGQLWLIAVVPGSFLLVDGMARLRVSVVSTALDVQVRNRWRTHRVPLMEIQSVRTETVEWMFKQPTYVGTRTGMGGSEWLVATIVDIREHSYQCDALISRPGLSSRRPVDPTPTETKVDTLRRWIKMHSDRRDT